MFKDRRIPEGLWYENGLRYSVLLQKKPAALVYVIAGTGADCASPDMITIAEMLYSAGFSTVLLSSPTDPNFIVNASSNFIPGRPSQDAHDLYEVMKRLDPEITAESHATGHMLIGYSLGALDALFTARLDSEENALHFGKTLLINPPLNLYSSIKTLDRMFYKALPHGVDDADNFVKKTVKRLSSLKQSNDALDFGNEKLLLDAYNKYKPNDRQLQTIIGMSFRLAATNMIFVSDVMGHHGYVFPKNEEFTTGTHLNHYFAVTLRVRFQDYFNELYAHYYLAANPGLTKQALIDEDDVAGFAPFIKTHNIGVVTNADDIILAPGEYDRLVRLFGSKAITFPTGGHLGNLGYPAVAYRIIEFMKQ